MTDGFDAERPHEGLSPGEVTLLLNGLNQGRDDAYDELIPLVYGELRAVADRLLAGERKDHTLSPTSLVHEAYMRLVQIDRLQWQGRAHFFAIAAMAMRRLLVDHGKARRAQKRGGGRERVEVDPEIFGSEGPELDVVELHEALEKLEELDPRQARVVELRFFGGLEVGQVAEVLGVSERTVKNDWRVAKLWLLKELSGS
ncbi:MAG: sigma-70 family RNA polymerase sigma factor [Planctomycetes bacterium]|nr:sigma-70 family RNA polymerase sigma factor [Planctomycetota bacterium]